jgi:acetoin utilization protein AcuB
MYVNDVMTANVVTIPSSTSIADAKRIMTAHRIERLPVVDKGKLVGIVTARRLDQVSPSKATSLTVWELSYLLEKTTVKEIMEKHVVTVPPDMTVEEAVSVAQSNRVGSLVVLEDSRVVGIVTTNDFFYRIVNPLLGVAKFGAPLPGTRVEITGGGEGKAMEEIISITNKLGMKISTLHSMPPVEETVTQDICIHLENEDVSQLVSELESKGYSVKLRKFS